jgi:ribosomal 30S subunit maturation factor RimM
MSPKIPTDYQPIGILGKTYQLQGGLRFYVEVDDELALGLERVFIEGIGQSDVRKIQQVGKDLIIYLTYALNKETAQKLVNRKVYVHADTLPEDEILELIGLPLFLDNRAFGHVVAIEEGMQDLLIIESQGQEYLIPLKASYVRITESGIFLENIPKGLLE